MVARYLEEKGIPTLCIGSAYDILLAGRAPRSVFLDYPLGHSCGKPFDGEDQYKVIKKALKIFETVSEPGQITALELNWGSEDWKIQASSTAASDTRQPRDTSPQFQYPEDREAAIESGAIKP